MPAKKSNGLLQIEHPKGSGILIREVVNLSSGVAYGGSFEVTISAKVRGRGKGGRIRKRFSDLSDAKRFAEQQHKGFGERGKAFFRLDSQRQDEVAALVPVLEAAGRELDEFKKFLKSIEGSDIALSEIAEGLDRLKESGLSFERSIEFSATQLVAERSSKTFADVVEELIQLKERRVRMGDLRPVSLEDFSYRARRMSKAFGDVALELLSRDRVIDWIQGLDRSGRSNENYRRVCVEVFNFAMDEGYVKFSPLSGFRGQKKKALTGSLADAGSIEILSVAEAERLLASAMELEELGLLGYVALTLFCGVRAEEAKRLEWRDVHDDLSNPYLTISGKIAKKRRIRNVEIPENALLWLSLVKDRSGKVVTFRDKNHFDRMFRKLRAHAGFCEKGESGGAVSTWSNNAIRHSYGTYHFALHEDPIKTAVQMGHKSNDQVLFDHYRALATKEEGQAFFSIVPPKAEEKLVEFG